MRTQRAQITGLFLLFSMLSCCLWAPGATADEATRIKLFHAKLENLQQTLMAKDGPERLKRLRPDVEVELGGAETRELSGLRMERVRVRLRGLPSSVLNWLSRALRLRYALTPPMKARRSGRVLELELQLWSLQGGSFRKGDPMEGLEKLESNLNWLGEQVQQAGEPSLAMLSRMFESELVTVDGLDWSDGLLKPRGLALSARQRRALIDELGKRIESMPHPPRLHAKAVVVQPEVGKRGAGGLQAADLDGASLLAELARLSGQDLLAALPAEGARLDGALSASRAAELMAPAARSLGLVSRDYDGVRVVAPRLQGKPDAARLPRAVGRPLSLRRLHAKPEELWALLVEGAAWLTAGDAPLRLTLHLRDRGAAQVAVLLAWAQGLRIESLAGGKLLLPVPAGLAPLKVSGAKGEVWRLAAAGAPVGSLLEGLLGRKLRLCSGSGRPVFGRSPALPAEALKQVLLSLGGLELKGEALRLRDASAGACGEPAAGGEDRLSAVLLRGKRRSALVADGGRWRWMKRGQRLGDGRELVRVGPSAVSLRGADGKQTRLRPAPLKAEAARSFDAAQFPLARLRLAGTLHFPNGQARALLEDPLGGQHSVGIGDLVGRRCGKVISLTPGRLVVQMGCPGAGEPKKAELHLRKR